MERITREKINRVMEDMRSEIVAEIVEKGVKTAFQNDTYRMWEKLINKPYSSDIEPSEEECTLRAFAILDIEIRTLIQENQSICVNLLIDEQSFFGMTFYPKELKLTEKAVIIHGTAASLEIAWRHIDSVELDSVANGFLLGKAEESGHSLIWCIDWVGFPKRK